MDSSPVDKTINNNNYESSSTPTKMNANQANVPRDKVLGNVKVTDINPNEQIKIDNEKITDKSLISKKESSSPDKALIEEDNEEEKNDEESRFKLLTAAEEFNPTKFEELIKSGYDIHEKDDFGYNAIHIMINTYVELDLVQQMNSRPKALDILGMLMQAGFDINSSCKLKSTPLHIIALYNYYPEIIKALLAAGAKINILDSKGRSPLHIAISKRNYQTVKTLVEGGGNVNIPNKEGMTPLHLAAQGKRNLNLIQLLLQCGANVHMRDVAGRYPLHMAAKYGREELMAELLRAEAHVNALDNAGATPLHYSVKGDLTGNATLLLLNHGAHLNTKDVVNEETALHKSIKLNMVENTKQLLKFRPNLNAQDIQGETSLHAAAVACHDIIIWQLLLKKGGDIYIENRNGQTPLRKATKAKNQVALGVIKMYDDTFTW